MCCNPNVVAFHARLVRLSRFRMFVVKLYAYKSEFIIYIIYSFERSDNLPY